MHKYLMTLLNILKTKQLRAISLMIFLNVFFIFPAYAGTIPLDELVDDFKVVDAALITFPNGLFMINKGSSDGVREGELWTVFSAGKAVEDPATGKKLGFLRVPVAEARVTSVAENFSQISIKLQDKSKKIKSGMLVRRFDKVDTIFQDSSGLNFADYEILRTKLPHLNWKAYLKDKNKFKDPDTYSGILITVLKDRITAWCGGEVLGVYKLETDSLAGPVLGSGAAQRTMAHMRQERLLLPGIRTPSLTREVALQSYSFVKTFDDLIYNIKICKIDGKPYYIYLTEQGLYARETDGSSELFHYNYKGFGDVVGAYIMKDGLIALNIMVQYKGMESQVLRFEDNKFNLIADNIHYILGFLDLDGNGDPESLIGQEYNQENFYGINTYLLEVKKNSIKKIKKLSLPSGFELFGSFRADLDGNGKDETGFYNLGRKLNIYEEGKKKWSFLSPMGGSLQSFSVSLSDNDAILRNVVVWSEPAVINLGNQKGVALATNKSNLISRVVDINPNEGGVAILLADKGGRFFLSSIDINFQGPVQSVFLYKDMLYCLVIEGNYFTRIAKSHLIKFSLDEFISALNQKS
jgi:hypothetical protein